MGEITESDGFERDLEFFDRMTAGIKDAASRSADGLGDAVGDVVDAVDHLAGVVTDIVDRMRGIEDRLAKLEMAVPASTPAAGGTAS